MAQGLASLRDKIDYDVIDYLSKDMNAKFLAEAEQLQKWLRARSRPPTGEHLTFVLTRCVEQQTKEFWQVVAAEYTERKVKQTMAEAIGSRAGVSRSQIALPDFLGKRDRNDPRQNAVYEKIGKILASSGQLPDLDLLKFHYSLTLDAFLTNWVGHALPTAEFVTAIAQQQLPVLEIGAGTGFMGKYIKDHVPYVATDNGAGQYKDHFVPIETMDGREAFDKYRPTFKRMGVLLSYPPTQLKTEMTEGIKIGDKSWEGHAVENYNMPLDVARQMETDDVLFYVGKFRGHEKQDSIIITGSPRFHDYLEENFELQEFMALYRWLHGANPELTVWKKTAARQTLG